MRGLLGIVGRFGLVGLVVGVTVVSVGSTASAQEDVASPWSSRRVLNVAHAGGDLEAPHSTLFAMKQAVAAGTDVLEMDLRLSSDGVLMIHHDDTVDRTTETTGPMNSFTAAELQALDNAYWFVPDCWRCQDRPVEEYRYRGIRSGSVAPPKGFAPSDFNIPTLADVVAAFPDRLLDVEIKDGPDGLATATALAEFIVANGPADRYLVASFDDGLLDHFKALAPAVATSPGVGTLTDWFFAGGPLPDHQVLQVPPFFSGIEVVTQDFVDKAHANGLAVWVWFNGTDDDVPEVWQRLIDMGVDGLLTGRPAAAQQVIDANEAAFTSAPVVDPVASVRSRTATIGVECPALHVDTCSSRMVLVALDRSNRLFLVADTKVEVVRGTTSTRRVRIDPKAQRLLRREPLTVYALMFANDSDTAPVISAVTLTAT